MKEETPVGKTQKHRKIKKGDMVGEKETGRKTGNLSRVWGDQRL